MSYVLAAAMLLIASACARFAVARWFGILDLRERMYAEIEVWARSNRQASRYRNECKMAHRAELGLAR